MHSVVAVNFRNKHSTCPDIIACKIPLAKYKELIDQNLGPYDQKNLKKAYRTICRVYPFNEINFYIEKGYIYLFQAGRYGISHDLMVLEIIKNLF